MSLASFARLYQHGSNVVGLKLRTQCCKAQCTSEQKLICAGDLDKLLGSRLKSVRPTAAVRQTREAADSPVAALRGQLRRVKLEEGVQVTLPTPSSPQDRLGDKIAGASSPQVVCS